MSRRRLLAVRKEALIGLAAAQRQQLAGEVSDIAAGLSLADRATAVLRRLTERPALTAVGLAALLLLGPFRSLRFALRAYAVLSAVRGIARS